MLLVLDWCCEQAHMQKEIRGEYNVSERTAYKDDLAATDEKNK